MPVLVASRDQRREHLAQLLDERARACLRVGAVRASQRLEHCGRGRTRALGELQARLRPAIERRRSAARRSQGLERSARAHRAHAVQELQQPEPAQLVGRVVAQAKQRDQILHVGSVEEPQAAVLHERNPPPCELELEQI